MSLVISGQLLLPAEGCAVRLAPGWLRVEGAEITEVVEGDVRADADIGGADMLVSPGFIDAHVHLPQLPCVGAHGMRLLDWLQQVVYPAETRWGDPVHATAECHRAVRALVGQGTTGIFAFCSNHYHGAAAALEVCAEMGLRAKIGQALSDRGLPAALCRSSTDNLRDCERLLDAWPEATDKRVCAAVAPRFALTCGGALLEGCGRLAAERSAFVETHLAEMEPECEQACALHGVDNYASIYARSGLLGPRSFMGHCIHLSPDERHVLRHSGSIAVHCPTSNSFLRSGVMNRVHWMREGLEVALGSDIAGGYERSMVRVARAMLETAFYAGEAAPTAAHAWGAVTRGNARLLGWEQAGCLAAGMDADMVIARPDRCWLEAPDPLGFALWGWDDRWLKKVLLRGNIAHTA